VTLVWVSGRYLWTDAFGICNYITLACETGDANYLDQVCALISSYTSYPPQLLKV
jgi:hypothetical protein